MSDVVIAYFSIGQSVCEFWNIINLKEAVLLPWPYIYGVFTNGVTRFVDWTLHMVSRLTTGEVTVYPPLAVTVM